MIIRGATLASALLLSVQANAMCMLGMGGDCPPSDETAKAGLAQEVSWMFAGTNVACDILQFQKVNGMLESPAPVYAYQFTASVACKGPPVRFDLLHVGDHLQGVILSAFGGFNHIGGSVDFNRAVSISGVLQFNQTEKGWIYVHGP